MSDTSMIHEIPLRSKSINVHEGERILSVASGALVLLCALDRRPLGALTGFLIGGGLVYRGLTGHCQLYDKLGISTAPNAEMRGVPAQHGERLERQLVIQAPPEKVYKFWRELSNLPSVLTHVSSVVQLDERHSRWKAETPHGTTLEWQAEIITDEPNRLIAWQSLPGGSLSTAGSVRFEPLGKGEQTRVTLNLKYDPPGGKLGVWVAKALGVDLLTDLNEDLRAFKQQMETPSVAGTPRKLAT
ncbi:MAG: SRPBCC family protein [Planctomycetia bacterium]|nr:SRPBCC family protein [Planctomycetia bacterium]